MANNRLWAVCKDDNECDVLTKYYPCSCKLEDKCVGSGWGSVKDWNDIGDFLTAHEHCPSNQGCGENILWVGEQDDPRIKLYDFTRSEENGGKIKIFLNEIPLTT